MALTGEPTHCLLVVPTSTNLLDSFQRAGFEIEQQWQPAEKAALFVVARKPA